VSTVDSAEVGPIRDLPREQVMGAFSLVRQGRVIDLAVEPAAGSTPSCWSRTVSTLWRVCTWSTWRASASTSSCSSRCQPRIVGTTGSMIDPVAVV